MPISADLDMNGKTEMIFGFNIFDKAYASNYQVPEAYASYVTVIDTTGAITASRGPLLGHQIDQLAVGRIIGTEKPSIVALFGDTWASFEDHIMAFKETLTTIFDFSKVERINGFSIGDVDNDGNQEIVVPYRNMYINGTPSGIQILDGAGNVKRDISIPVLSLAEDLVGANVDDFTGSGHNEIMVQSIPWDANKSGIVLNPHMSIFAFNLGGSMTGNNLDWKTALGDYQNTGCFGPGCKLFANVPIATSTASSSVLLVGPSTLNLSYDVNGQEAVLASNFTVQFTAGNHPERIAQANAFSTYLTSTDGGNVYGYSQYDRPMGTSYDGTFYTVPPFATVKFNVRATYYPRLMFAGTYHGVMDHVLVSDVSGNNLLAIPTPNITNGITIVGELSPYIDTITPNPVMLNPAIPSKQTLSISGSRFALNGNIIRFQKMNTPVTTNISASSMNMGKLITITLPVPVGTYNVYVTNPLTGDSNNVMFQVQTLGTAPATTSPVTPAPQNQHQSSSGGGSYSPTFSVSPSSSPVSSPYPSSSPAPSATAAPQSPPPAPSAEPAPETMSSQLNTASIFSSLFDGLTTMLFRK
jgi:hypothetical protein